MNYLKNFISLLLIISYSLLNAEEPSNMSADDSFYNQKTFELSSILYGVIEIGGKNCKAAGTAMPKSLEKWWQAVDAYEKSEITRNNQLSKKETEIINSFKDSSLEKQIDIYQKDKEHLEAGINSISGENGRISIRKKLLEALKEVIKMNEKEHEKNVLVYKKFTETSFNEAMNEAKEACARIKTTKTCETNESGQESCQSISEPNPVPGCQDAINKLPEIISGPVKKYEELYLKKQMASADLQSKMEELEKEMTTILESIPKSDDKEFDWSTTMEESLALLKKTRKDAGIICPSSDSSSGTAFKSEAVTNGAKDFFNSIGAPSLSNEVTNSFSQTWNLADSVVGQPGQRPAYFNYVNEKLTDILSLDDAYLSRALETKAKYEKLISDVNEQISSGNGASTNQNNQNQNSNNNQNQINTTLASSGSSENGNNSQFGSRHQNQGDQTVTTEIVNPRSSIGSLGGPVSSASLLDIRNQGTQNFGNSGAIGTPKKSTNSTQPNKIQIDNKNATNKFQQSENKKSFKSLLASVKNGKNQKKKSVISMNRKAEDLVVVTDKLDNVFDKLNDRPEAKELYKVASVNLFHREITNYVTDDSSDGADIDNNSNKSKINNEYQPIVLEKRKKSKNKQGPLSKLSDEDVEEEKVAEGEIVEKKKNKFFSKNMFKPHPNDTLFQIVTKAYFRNIDKVDSTFDIQEEN